jgi:hypothetical protein
LVTLLLASWEEIRLRSIGSVILKVAQANPDKPVPLFWIQIDPLS